MPMNMIIQEKRKELGLTQEIGMFCNELAMLARDNIVSAFELAEAKLHEFPHNEQLRLNVTIILDSSLLQSHSTDVPKEELDTKVPPGTIV